MPVWDAGALESNEMDHSQSHNPFLMLGLETRFFLDSPTIERAYLTRLALVHPDSGGDGSGDEIDSAMLNRARSILLDHEKRAIALLDVLGGPNASTCKELPDGFLLEMMSRRQEIEEQIAGGYEARARWERWARDERAVYCDQVGTLFEGLGDEPTDEQLVEIRVVLNAWRYIERLIEQLDPDYDPASADFR